LGRRRDLDQVRRPLRGLELTSALSYTDTKLKTRFESYRPGDRIPNIPKFSANVNARYTLDYSNYHEADAKARLVPPDAR